MGSRPSRWRTLAKNLAVSAGALLILGLILEGIIRVGGFAYDPQFDRRGQGIIIPSADPEIRRELPADYEGVMLGGSVRTNSFGMRGPAVSLEKPPGVFRIAVLGDSWAFGWGVDQGREFPAVLEELLQQRAGSAGTRYQVLNFSVSAYNTLQELAVLRKKALRFSPDLVLVAYNVNDVEKLSPDGEEGGHPEGHGGGGWEAGARRLERRLTRYSHLIRLVDDRMRRLALKLEIERSGKVDHYRSLYAPGAEPWERVQAALREMRDRCAQAGARIYLVHCPWIHILDEGNPYRDIHRQVLAAAAEMGIPALDLFDTFEGRDAASLRISPLDGHPTAEGHRLAAEAIAEDLLRRQLIGAADPGMSG